MSAFQYFFLLRVHKKGATFIFSQAALKSNCQKLNTAGIYIDSKRCPVSTNENLKTLRMPLPRDFVARDCKLNYLQESLWDPGLLQVKGPSALTIEIIENFQAKCKQLGLEEEFEAYMIRRWTTYLHVFFILHICVTLIHCVLVLTLSEVRDPLRRAYLL